MVALVGSTVTSVLLLAALTEALVEFLVAGPVDSFLGRPKGRDPKTPEEQRKADLAAMIKTYIAVAVGIALCFGFRANLLEAFGLVPEWPWIGYLVTGALIGRGSNFVHDFSKRWLATRI